MERRDFELPDPDWMRDLSHCPLSDRDKELLEKFWTELENDRMEHTALAVRRHEEMLIARVHVFVNVMQVRGQQYKYRGHIVHFLRDVGKVYSQLPLLPP
ncbi:hypothetical protein FOFC_20902 [Fusarium oxysporum]|nr:hypothetical protein FOFC_20902 [Fusarium oxysporum]